jgi:uncharacterized protein (TIGR02246 family)
MTRLVSSVFALALLTSIPVQAQVTAADDAAIRDVVRRYVDAREARDPEAVAALFTADADQLVSSGEWRRGRDVLVKGTMASSARTTGTRTVVVETIRMVGPDVAMADGRYEISGAETRKMWSTFVMARQQSQWRISAIRNMLPAPPAAAAAATPPRTGKRSGRRRSLHAGHRDQEQRGVRRDPDEGHDQPRGAPGQRRRNATGPPPF